MGEIQPLRAYDVREDLPEFEDASELTTTMSGDVAQRMAPGQRRPMYLRQVEGPGSPGMFVLTGEAIVIGRSPLVDLQVQSFEVSRKHLRVTRVHGEVIATDMGSRNGTFLNGLKIRSAVLKDGDMLQLGNAVFLYQEGG